MVIIKYKVKDEGMFISPENMERIWKRLLAMSRIKVEKTKEKSPKDILFFLKKADIGVESQSEFVAFETPLSAREVEGELENNLPKWLVAEKIVDLFQQTENPFNEETLSQFKLVQTEIDEKKGGIKEFFSHLDLEQKKCILSYEIDEDCVIFVAKDKNFAVLKFVNALLRALDLEKKYFQIIKEETYYERGGKVELFENKLKSAQEE